MAVPILQTFVGVIFSLLGIALTGKATTTKKEQSLCRVVFIFLGVLFAALSWIQFANAAKNQNLADERIRVLESQTLNTNQPSVQPAAATVQQDNGVLESNLVNVQTKYRSLLNELATNPSLDPNLRERIIITKAKLAKETRNSNGATP